MLYGTLLTMNDHIRSAALSAISRHVFPGCVIGYVTRDGKKEVIPCGYFTYEEDSPVVEEDTMYDTASLTKSIVTSTLALMLIDQGRLKLADKLKDFVPEFRNSDKDIVTIKHLLTYTIDGYGLASLKLPKPARMHDLFEVLMTRDFQKRPGTEFKYSNIPATFLGLVIENITGKTLDSLADELLFIPLNMKRSTFFPERFPYENIVPTEIDDNRGLVRGIVHDESAYLCKQEGKIVGHAGLFSTMPDILTYLEMLLRGGELDGKRYVSEEMVHEIETNQTPELKDEVGLGFEIHQPRYMGQGCTQKTFGKTGFTGTLIIVDREKGVAYSILSNRTYPYRPPDAALSQQFRKEIGDIIFAHLK